MSLPISGFTAVPNPQMLAFMAAQSFVMMMQAGEGWQYGKRKQSAMTNEEFNKQTPLSIMQRQMSELKAAIPTISQNMNNMTPMIRQIVIQYGDFLAEIVKATPDILKAAGGNQTLEGNILTVLKEFKQIAESTTTTHLDGTPHPSYQHSHAASAPKQTFTQEQQNIQDNPPSNVPITLQGMTKKEIENAYSDMLSGRLSLTSSQKQELTLAFKKTLAGTKQINPTITAPFQEIPQESPAMQKYFQDKMNARIPIIAARKLIETYTSLGSGHPAYGGGMPRATKELATAIKKMQNIITQARGVIATKSQANNDWNKRIWNLPKLGI